MSIDSSNSEYIKYKPVDKIQTYSSEDEFNTETVKNNKFWIDSNRKEFSLQNKQDVSVFDVAAYIVNKIGNITTMKLHKLLYYSQAWALVWDEKPLFKEDVEAWANGPVIRELFAYHKGYYDISNINVGNPDLLSIKQKETINSILEYYGNKSAQWLIELTHLESPWKNARKGMSQTERGDRIISKDAMADYYSSL